LQGRLERRKGKGKYIPRIGEIDVFPHEFHAVLAKCGPRGEWIVMYNMGGGVFMDELGRVWVFSEKKWYSGDLCPFDLIDESPMFMQEKGYSGVFFTTQPWI